MRIISFSTIKNNNENPFSFKQANKNTFIFDWDGTLADSKPFQKEAWQETANKAAGDYFVPPISIDTYYNHGMSRKDNLATMFDKLGLTGVPEEIKKSYGDVKAELYESILRKTAKEKGPDSLLIPGARTFLTNLQDLISNSKLIVASNALGAVSAIKAAQLDRFFDKSYNPPTIVDGADKGILYKASKPEPDIFIAAAKLQGSNPKDCIVFEDSMEGIEAAAKAGMRFVVIGDLKPQEKDFFKLMIGAFQDFTKIDIPSFARLIKSFQK